MERGLAIDRLKSQVFRMDGGRDPHSLQTYEERDVMNELKGQGFGTMMDRAYSDPRGVSFRYNPDTGKNEMFVAGTRNYQDHTMNIVDGLYTGLNTARDIYGSEAVFGVKDDSLSHFFLERLDFRKLDFVRNKQSRSIEKIARDHNVDVIFGHSRGAAIISDVSSDFKRIGVDGAMIISSDTSIDNYHDTATFSNLGTGVFDEFLALRGESNHVANINTKFHNAWN